MGLLARCPLRSGQTSQVNVAGRWPSAICTKLKGTVEPRAVAQSMVDPDSVPVDRNLVISGPSDRLPGELPGRAGARRCGWYVAALADPRRRDQTLDRLYARCRYGEWLGRRACELRPEDEADARDHDHDCDGGTPSKGKGNSSAPSLVGRALLTRVSPSFLRACPNLADGM